MHSLSGRTIAVTGAGSGIGRALALNLAQRGAKLALADKDDAGLLETSRLLGNYPHFAESFDVTDTAKLEAWVERSIAEFGALDGIINNAGLSVVAPFADCPPADFDRVMNVNFDAVVAGCRAALPHVRKSQHGWIVNISSVFGMMGYPTQSAYNASKFAVRGFTEALYLELGVTDPHVTVIRVHPGGIKTNVAKNAKKIATMTGEPMALDSDEEFQKAAKTTPEQAAEIIVRGMEKGQHRVLIGADAKMIDILTRLFPVSYFKKIGGFLGGGNAQPGSK